jgi:hypothetical protein
MTQPGVPFPLHVWCFWLSIPPSNGGMVAKLLASFSVFVVVDYVLLLAAAGGSAVAVILA